jgi:hypothetical protein
MAEKEGKMEGEEAAWKYEHPTEHPDNKPPVTVVAEPSEEAVADYERSVNAALEKGQPKDNLVPLEVPGGPEHKATPKVDYESKTVVELKDLAKERGVEVSWDARKDEIIKALEKQDKEKSK